MPDKVPEVTNPEVGFERKDIRSFAVTATGIGVLLGTLIIVFSLWFLLAYLNHSHPQPQPRPGLAPEYGHIREPLLQADPRNDLRSLRGREDKVLNGYGWVDRSKGVVSIPVDRAMDLLMQRGMPQQAPYADLKLFPPRGGSRQTGFDRVENRE